MDLAPLFRKLEDVDLTIKEPGPPTGHGNEGAPDIAKKRYEVK